MPGGVGTLQNSVDPDVVLASLPNGMQAKLRLSPCALAEEHPPSRVAQLDQGLAQLSIILRTVADQPRFVAANLIERFGSVSAVLSANAGQLASVDGMNGAAVQLIRTTNELMVTAQREQCFGRLQTILSPNALRVYLQNRLRPPMGEAIRGLFLDRANGLLEELGLAPERTGYRVPCARFVARHAVACGAAAVIIARTDPAPIPMERLSEVESAKQIATALGLLGIALHDYVIVGRAGTLSMRERTHL